MPDIPARTKHPEKAFTSTRLHRQRLTFLRRAGEAVLIERGPLQGLEGIVIRSKGKAHVVVSIGAIGRSLMAEVNIEDCAVNSSSTGVGQDKRPA